MLARLVYKYTTSYLHIRAAVLCRDYSMCEHNQELSYAATNIPPAEGPISVNSTHITWVLIQL